MKTKIATSALLLAAAISFNAHSADLEVQVSGVRSDQGDIRLALYDDAGSYLKKGRGLHVRVIRAAQGSVSSLFKDLPVGTFALGIYHDENRNGELEKNLFGIPTEGYGFSNNAKTVFGSPSFSDAAFIVDRENITIKVNLSY